MASDGKRRSRSRPRLPSAETQHLFLDAVIVALAPPRVTATASAVHPGLDGGASRSPSSRGALRAQRARGPRLFGSGEAKFRDWVTASAMLDRYRERIVNVMPSGRWSALHQAAQDRRSN